MVVNLAVFAQAYTERANTERGSNILRTMKDRSKPQLIKWGLPGRGSNLLKSIAGPYVFGPPGASHTANSSPSRRATRRTTFRAKNFPRNVMYLLQAAQKGVPLGGTHLVG